MRRDTDKTRKTSRGRYCNNATDFMSIVYLVGVILLALHLFVLQIVDIHKYREKGRMQRASHDFAVRGDIYDRHGIKLATDRIYYMQSYQIKKFKLLQLKKMLIEIQPKRL